MAFEINDLKGIFILVLFAIPMIATTNINCNGRAFHCVNSTHFMICVDLGGGLSTTIDDFVIPCPATTVCHENNSFECDFPEVTTIPPLEVVGVYKQSDTSEPTTVTNSVTPTSEIFSVFNENLTATTLPIPEDVTPVVKLEVLENIKDPVRINSDYSTEKSVKVTSSIFDTENEIFNDKQTRNLTVITSATDNNKTFAPAVETSIYKSVNTSLIDKSISNDTVTPGIGLINLISADAPIVVITKPHSEVLTSLDSSFDTIATTTEPYKEVTTLGETVDNPMDDINISTEAIIIKSSVIIDEVSTTSEVNRYNESNVHNSTDNINKSDINNQNIAERNTSIRSNITIEVVPETKRVDVTSAQTDNITEPVTVVDSPQTTTVNTFVSSGTIDLITANPNQSVPSTNDYIDTLTIDAAPTNDQYTTNLEATLSVKPIDVELINTTPAIDTVVENNSKSDINNNSFSELNSTSTVEIVPVLKINYSIPAEEILQTTKEHTFVPITTVASILNNTETETISEVLFNNDSPIENQTIISQPLDVIIATDSPIAVTDNLYQINGELNQTLITTKNTISDTINTTDKEITELNATSKSIITEKNTEHALPLPSNIKDPALEKIKTETLLNVVSQRELEVTIESPVVNVANNYNEQKDNVKNNTLFKTSNTSSTAFNSSSTESTFTTSTTTTFFTIELSSAETSQNDFVIKAIEVKKELNERATSGVDEPKLVSNGTNALLNVHTTPATYKVTSDLVPDILAMDISSQKDQQTDFTPESTHNTTTHKSSYVYTEINQGTTQQTNAVSESPNQSENSEIISLLKNRTDDKTLEEVVGITTTPFTRDFTENTSLGDIVESINQDKVAASDIENSEHKALKPILSQAPVTVDYVTDLASMTPNTAQTVPIGIDSTIIPVLVSSHNSVTDDLYRTSTASYIEKNTRFPVDVTHTINKENVPDVLITALPLQQSSNQIISTVKQLNTTNSPTETISDLDYTTVITDVDNITDLNTSNWKNTENIDTVSSRVQDANANVKTEISDPINGEKNDNANSSVVNTNRDNGIKIMSIVDVVTSTENVMLSGTMQPSSLNPSLSTDYIATTASHDSSAYVTATDNVPNYNLVHNESVSQKISEATVSLIATNISNADVSTQTTLPVTETNIGNVQYVSTEANFPRNLDFKEDNSGSTVGDYAAQKKNDHLPTEEMSSLSNIVPNVQAVTFPGSGNVTPDNVLTQGDSTIAPIYDKVSAIKDNAFIMSSTEISPGVLPHSNIIQGTESPPLKLKVKQSSESQTAKYNEDSSSPILEMPVAQFTIEPTHATILTTPSAVTGPKNQEIITGMKTTVLPQYMMSALPIEPVTSKTSYTTFSQTTPSVTISQTNQDVFIGIKTTDLPQDVTMTIVNNNIPQSVSSLPKVGVTTAQIITEPTPTAIFVQTPIDQDVPLGLKSTVLLQYEIPMVKNNNPQTMPAVGSTIAQTTPIASDVKKSQDMITETKTTELPQYVISTFGNNNQQSMPTLPTINLLTENDPTEIKTINLPGPVTVVTNNNPEPISSLVRGVTVSQSTTGPTHTSNEYAKTTPLLAATVNTKQDVPSGMTLPQYVTTSAIYKNPQSISDITTETIIDSLSAPDSMVETISVVGDTITDTIPSSVTFTSRPTAIKADNSVKNIIDHESIVIATTSKTTKSVDYNRAEIVNHTESNWMPSDVNIDNLKIKQSSNEETDSLSSVSKSGKDVQNTATAKIDPKDVTPTDKIENRLTTATFTTNYNGSESVSQNNASQPKIVAAKDKKTEIYYPANANIAIIDVTKYQVPADSQIISNSNNENNTKANITTSHYNLSQQNSTINDELEQHLVSTNHTITAEVQSHLNESDKQSNKTRDEVTVNATMHNPDLTSTILNASSKDTTVITVPASVFNCTNHTRGKYADTKDCRKFYTCIGTLQAILGTCPNNTVFSEINKQCTRNLSHCVRNNQFRCLFEGRFSDFFKDNIYYICVKNRIHGFIRYKLQCQADYHLNKDSVKCEKNEEISIQSVSSVSETNNDESKPKPKSEKKVSTDDFECESEGKFPYAEDCIKYYECTKVKNVYRRKIKKCVSDEVFDKKKKKCVESDSGEC